MPCNPCIVSLMKVLLLREWSVCVREREREREREWSVCVREREGGRNRGKEKYPIKSNACWQVKACGLE